MRIININKSNKPDNEVPAWKMVKKDGKNRFEIDFADEKMKNPVKYMFIGSAETNLDKLHFKKNVKNIFYATDKAENTKFNDVLFSFTTSSKIKNIVHIIGGVQLIDYKLNSEKTSMSAIIKFYNSAKGGLLILTEDNNVFRLNVNEQLGTMGGYLNTLEFNSSPKIKKIIVPHNTVLIKDKSASDYVSLDTEVFGKLATKKPSTNTDIDYNRLSGGVIKVTKKDDGGYLLTHYPAIVTKEEPEKEQN